MAAQTTKILMTTDAVGGVWQYSLELTAGLRAHGIETTLAVLQPGLNAAKQREAHEAGCAKVIDSNVPLDWLSDAATVRSSGKRLSELAEREGVDLVHLNSPTFAADRPFRVPVVTVAHGCVASWWEAAKGEPLDSAYAWHRLMMARGLRAADLVIAPSASFARTMRRVYSLPAEPTVVYNGRSPAADGPAPVHDFALTVGRLWDPVKNAAVLDEVAARLPFPLYAAGPIEGPHGEAITLRHLHPLGTIAADDLHRRLASRPAFVSAATFEPFGLAVLEAALAGCPLILSDIGTFRELWDGAATFVAPDDAKGFARAIDAAITYAAERHRLGDAAKARARLYSAEKMAAAMAQHYGALLAKREAA